MGFFSWLKDKLTKKTKWQNKKDEFIQKYSKGRNVDLGTKILVGENQKVIIIARGKMTDVFSQGEFELSPVTLPATNKRCKLTKGRKNKKTGIITFPDDFEGSILFVNMDEIEITAKSKHIRYKDKIFGKISYFLNYNFNFQVCDIRNFGKHFITRSLTPKDKNYKRHLVYLVNKTLQKTLKHEKLQLQKLMSLDEEIHNQITQLLNNLMSKYGIAINKLTITNFNLSKRNQKRIASQVEQGNLLVSYISNSSTPAPVIQEQYSTQNNNNVAIQQNESFEPQINYQNDSLIQYSLPSEYATQYQNEQNIDYNSDYQTNESQTQNISVTEYSMPSMEEILKGENTNELFDDNKQYVDENIEKVQENQKICLNCGEKLAKNANFCHICGTKL